MDFQVFVGSRARVRKDIWSCHNSTLSPVITSENGKKDEIATSDNLVLLNVQNIEQYISQMFSARLMKLKAFNSVEEIMRIMKLHCL